MRDQPLVVHRVAGEPASELIVDPAVRHLVQSPAQHLPSPLAPRLAVGSEQELQDRLLRKLGGVAETTVDRIERSRDVAVGLSQGLHTGEVFGNGHLPAYRLHQPPGLLQHLAATVDPGIGDRGHDPLEGGHPLPVIGREIGPREEWLPIGCQPHRHRPSPAACHRLDGFHVDRVDVGPFLAVDLDVDEEAVHLCGRLLVLEGLVGHHMAPMAGRVADAEQYRLVPGLRVGKRVVAPLLPVHGIVLVLEEVRRGGISEAVGHTVTVPAPGIMGDPARLRS